jgi:hypothetical protein
MAREDDALVRALQVRIIESGAALERALKGQPGGNIAVEILHRLYERLAESCGALVFLNPYVEEDREKIVTLQNECKRYDEWIAWLKEIINEGREYRSQLTQAEREDVLDYLNVSPDDVQRAIDLGLIDPNARED